MKYEELAKKPVGYPMTNKECLSYVRGEAKKLGCTLKEQKMSINGGKSYKFVTRGTDDWIIKNMTLGMALDNIESGRLAELAEKNR
jgi:hypothetical protein